MTVDQLIQVVGAVAAVGTVIVTLGIWWVARRERRFHEAIKRAATEGREEGAEKTLVEVQAKATERMFLRLEAAEGQIEWLKRRVQQHELLMAAADIFVPEGSQVGPDGRGARNPLRDP